MLKVMLHQTIRNEDFQRSTALQHFCDIVSNGYNIVPTLMQCCTVFTAVHFFLGGRQHFSFSHRRYKFMLFFQQKMAPYLSLFISVAIFLVELRWSVAYCHSLFLCFSLYLFSKFVDMTINLILILQTTRIRKQFPLSVFVFIDSLVVSISQVAGGYAISRQNNIELHLGCHTC